MNGAQKAVEIYIFPDEASHEPNVPGRLQRVIVPSAAVLSIVASMAMRTFET
jgi:hypothetical protein